MRNGRLVVLGLALVAGCLCAVPALATAPGPALVTATTSGPAIPTTATPSATPTPAWQLQSFLSVGGERSFKAQLIDELPAPPEIMIIGGSRATRFQPGCFLERTGLQAMNCAAQNCRPEDAFAFASRLYQRSPDTRLRCFFAVQVTTFADKQLDAGLLYDERLSQWFPADLLEEQKATLGEPVVREALGVNRFSARGLLLRSSYDIRRAQPGYSLDRRLDGYIKGLLPTATWKGPTPAPRAHGYFEQAMRLFNAHDVVPAVVIMPYHPRALRAFRAVGWQHKLDALLAYFKDAKTRCRFRVLNMVDIRTFGGRPGWFYDGAHVTRENSRLIIKKALAVAPECFR